MAGIWSSIKSSAPGLAAPPPRDETSPRAVGSSTIRQSSPARTLSTPPSSRPLPRPASSLDARGARSQASTTPQSHPRSPGAKSPSRLSRNSTSTTLLKDKGRGRDRESEAENADDAAAPATATTATVNASTSTVDVARTVPSPGLHTPGSHSAIDPLSQQILLRKNTEPSIPQRLTQMAEGLTRASSDLSRNAPPLGEVPKDKSSRRGSSFLSKLSMRGARKKDHGDLDSDSEIGSEARMDGINARVFSQAVGGPLVGGGYVPRHKEPPRYIRTRATNKRAREFNRMFLAQELVGTRPPEDDAESASEAGRAPVVSVSVAGTGDRKTTTTGGAIWATEFSKDGKYLATAGRDHVVRVWAVLSTPEERAHEDDEAGSGGTGERLSAPVFRDQPVREFQGHTGEVLDLSWSKNSFLLSSSMDKTVRLWHMSRAECLCTFKHKDFVTRLAFHPRDDRFFLAGSLDTMLRLWSIPDKSVAFSAQLPDLVTAVAFSPDGKVAIAGLLNGLCMFYETEGLKLSSQVHVRSSRGKNAKGSKITGIQTMMMPPPNPLDTAPSQLPGSAAASNASADAASLGEVRVLITSNDSRIRIYSLRDKALDVKLKGHENLCSQISATFSDDGKHVICGSEDRKAFIWSLVGSNALVHDKDKAPCEYFEAHGDIVTTAVFAPTKTRMLLGQSGDPIYDLCNPPPVVLQSLEEAASAVASQVALTNDSDKAAPAEAAPRRPEPSPAYIARSTHYDGHIIVTTGDTGIIKVFRQDCAFAKRRSESWETGSTFSRKLAAHGSGYIAGGLRRSGSVLTRTSAGSTAHSRRGSLSMPGPPGAFGSPQLAAVGAHPDRILSWRQGIENSGDRRSALFLNGNITPAQSLRSSSPAKASGTSLHSAYNQASEARKQPYAGASPARNRDRASSILTSPTASVFSNGPERLAPARAADDAEHVGKEEGKASDEQEPTGPPVPGFTLRSAAGESNPSPADPAGGSASFWNLSRWRGMTGFKAGSSGQGPATSRARGGGGGQSPVSKPRDQTRAQSQAQTGGSTDETEADGPAGETTSSLPDDKAKADQRKSLAPSPVLHTQGSSNASPVPVDGRGEEDRAHALEQGRGKGEDGQPPFQGHAHASRLGSK